MLISDVPLDVVCTSVAIPDPHEETKVYVYEFQDRAGAVTEVASFSPTDYIVGEWYTLNLSVERS